MNEIRRLAAKWLNIRRQAIASEPAIFKQGNLNIPVKVTRGQREEDFDNDTGGVSEKVIYQDFIVSREELIQERDTGYWTSRTIPTNPKYKSKTFVTPKSGDRIIIGYEIYELAPRDDVPCFESSDVLGNLLRLHTHLIQGRKKKHEYYH